MILSEKSATFRDHALRQIFPYFCQELAWTVRLGHEIIPMSYDVRDYARLGLLYKLLHVEDPQHPTIADVEAIRCELIDAIQDARRGQTDLGNRLQSDAAKQTRKAGIAVRAAMEAQWQNV